MDLTRHANHLAPIHIWLFPYFYWFYCQEIKDWGFFGLGWLFGWLGCFVRRNRADPYFLSLKIILTHSLEVLFFHKLIHIKYTSHHWNLPKSEVKASEAKKHLFPSLLIFPWRKGREGGHRGNFGCLDHPSGKLRIFTGNSPYAETTTFPTFIYLLSFLISPTLSAKVSLLRLHLPTIVKTQLQTP